MSSVLERPPSVLEIDAFPEDAAWWAASSAPGPTAAGAAGVLDPGRLSQAGRVDAIVAIERQIGWLQARGQRMLAALVDAPPDPRAPRRADPRKELVKEEVRAALGESGLGVGARVALARQLTGRLADTLRAVEDGRLTLRHARYLADALGPLDDDTARTVQDAVLPTADTGAVPVLGNFRRKVRREVLKADPRSAEQKLRDTLEDRRVSLLPGEHGTAGLWALLPAEGAQALMTVLDILAERCAPDDPRTKEQRRADALVQLALDWLGGNRDCPTCSHTPGHAPSGTGKPNGTGGGTSSGGGGHGPGGAYGSGMPRWHGMRPSVQISVALSTLLGYDEQPGDLDGYGPIGADLARRIAADDSGTWRRLVTDELGRLVDYGRTRYRPPADLAEFVTARDRTCVFRGCNRPACRCEIDHTLAWEDDGDTNEANLACLCCRHHHLKHEDDWSYQRLPNGDIEWISPTGHRHIVPAATYPIDHTAAAINDPKQAEHPATNADPDPPF